MGEFKYGEYLQITAPDKDRLSKMLNTCKGTDRTMAQYAEDSGVNASTLSRILNGKITKPLSYEMLVLIYDHKSGNADLSFEQLALANGMKEKEAHEREKSLELFYNDPIDKIERESEAQSIIVNSLLLRGAMIQIESKPRRFYYNSPDYRPSTWGFYPMIDFVVNIMKSEGRKEWDFYCYAKVLEEVTNEAATELANNIISMKMSFFLQDSWEPQLLEGIKSSFVLFEEKVFDAFVEQLKKAEIKSEVSAILIDYVHGKVQKEVWIRDCDQKKQSIFDREITMEDDRPIMGLATWSGNQRT